MCIFFLSNVTLNHLEEPQLIIFKPDNEVAKRINEYFISHGVDKESSLKIDQLLQLRDPEILNIYIYIYLVRLGVLFLLMNTLMFTGVNGNLLNMTNFIQRDNDSTSKDTAKILDFKNVGLWDKEISDYNNGKKYTNSIVN